MRYFPVPNARGKTKDSKHKKYEVSEFSLVLNQDLTLVQTRGCYCHYFVTLSYLSHLETLALADGGLKGSTEGEGRINSCPTFDLG